MPLFAIMNKNSAVGIYRIETDRKTDGLVERIFTDQLSYFETHHTTELPFEAGYKPSHNECSYIKKFPESLKLFDAINRSTSIPKWTVQLGLENIVALFMAPGFPTNKNKIAIQYFSKKQILNSSKYLWLSKGTFSMADSLGFNIEDKLVAVIEKNKIKFTNFNNLRSIFDMNKYFAAATDQDIDDFSKQPVFDVPKGFDLKIMADNVIRKKVTLINNSGILTNHTVSDIKQAANNLNFQINTSGTGSAEKITIPTAKKEIKELLDFLDEDYFKSEITKQRFRSNSKRKV